LKALEVTDLATRQTKAKKVWVVFLTLFLVTLEQKVTK